MPIQPNNRPPIPPFAHIGSHTAEFLSPRTDNVLGVIGAEDASMHLNDIKGPPKVKTSY